RAVEERHAAGARRKIPAGKSHSGRSPRSGLYTASAKAPASRPSARNVALVLRGSRPLSVTSPRVRSAATSGADDVAVAPRADVTAGVLGLAAHRADRPAGLHQRFRALDERRGLRARDREARRGRLLALFLADGLGPGDV